MYIIAGVASISQGPVSLMSCNENLFQNNKNLLKLRGTLKAAHRDLSLRMARALW